MEGILGDGVEMRHEEAIFKDWEFENVVGVDCGKDMLELSLWNGGVELE
jgi:hypothetical protein